MTGQPEARRAPVQPAGLTLAEQARMVAALRDALRARQGAHGVDLHETHISWVLVAGASAYKVKKAVDLGFLDATAPASRQRFCEEELRLNRRLAPALYLEVLPITGSASDPVLGGAGPPIDWAVHMRAFDQDALWDRQLARSALGPAQVDELAAQLHTFHRDAAVDVGGASGEADRVRAPMLDNLRVLGALLPAAGDRRVLHALGAWEARQFGRLAPVFERRRREGRVRECHGDLHLGNVVSIEGRTTVFDGIEFSADLRWIDVVSELAFMAMDLRSHGRADLAHRFVNASLELSGDYEGALLLRYYMLYRALVRVKVLALRSAQSSTGSGVAAPPDLLRRTLDAAAECTRSTSPALLITHGYSGSGKTSATQHLLEAVGAIRIRADVERKRLFGLQAGDSGSAAPNTGIYSAQATLATYARLCELAGPGLEGGHRVVLDATFLQRRQRDQARALAARHGAPFVILDFELDVTSLRRRIVERSARGGDASDADLAVLAAQMRDAQVLGEDERPAALACRAGLGREGTRIELDWAELRRRLPAAD